MDAVGRVNGEGGKSPETGPETGEARARQRDSLFMIAQLRLGNMSPAIDVRVRNLSPGGLMIELNRAIEPGAAVSLEMRGLGDVTGTVAWCTRGRVGIALDSAIDPKRARKPVGIGESTPEYAKPILAPPGHPR